MSPSDVQRKLAAIMSADVKGYSLLMGDDEVATVRTLTLYREIISGLVEEHHGRVVDSPGDNLLAEFASAVDAVECSARIQDRLKEENASLPGHRRMEFRIGINVGDVIVEQGRLYGDGVNIAARLEGLADGGGVCISGTVFDQIETKLDYDFLHLGPMQVKNITRPVRSYKIVLEPDSVTDQEIEAEPYGPPDSGPDRPDRGGWSGGGEHSGGIREGIEFFKKRLSRSVSSSSLSQELDRRVLRPMGDALNRGAESPTELVEKARAASALMSREANQEAQALFRLAANRAPEALEARTGLGWTYLVQWLWGWSRDPEDLERALDSARKALTLRPDSVRARLLLGWAHLWRKDHVPALAAGTKVLDQAPADPDGAAFTAFALTVTGLSEKAAGLIRAAVRKEPRNKTLHAFSLGLVFYHLRRYEEALDHLDRALAQSPDFPGAHLIKGLVFSEQGLKKESREEIKTLLRLNPAFSLKLVKKRYPFKNPDDLKRCLNGLKKAGLR